MIVAEICSANVKDHRPMPLDQCREGQFGRVSLTINESSQQIAIGQVSDCSQLIE